MTEDTMTYVKPRTWRAAVRRDAPRRLSPFLLLLGERARQDGTVHNTTRAWLAEQFNVDTRTIQRWIKDATGDGHGRGWLTVVRRGQKHVAAQVYGLTIPSSQGDIRSCSQGDSFYLPENAFSGRHLLSPIYRTSTCVSSFGAVEEDASANRTTAALATARPATSKQRNDENRTNNVVTPLIGHQSGTVNTRTEPEKSQELDEPAQPRLAAPVRIAS